jgi:hypothetical protein
MDNCRGDLELILQFLDIRKRGVDLNLITYLAPTHVYYLVSCPAGLGSYSKDGSTWQFSIPLNLHFKASNNLLELISQSYPMD